MVGGRDGSGLELLRRRPAWIGSGLERWLGANGNLGNQPTLLDEKTQVMESNMAMTREAWRSAGGFLGMDLFGSRHMAAGEIHYFLHQIHQLNNQVVLRSPGGCITSHGNLYPAQISAAWFLAGSDGWDP